MTPRAARLARGALLGTVATLLAALSHLAGGGPAPSGLALVLGAVFATAVGTIALGRVALGRTAAARRRDLTRTTVAVGVAQLAFHLGFSLLGTGGAVTASGSHHHALVAIAADPASAVAQGGSAMWLAHLAAGVLTVVYLRHLEHRVWAVLARLGGFLLRLAGLRMPQLPARRPRPSVSRVALRPASALLRDAIARRGPPLLLGA